MKMNFTLLSAVSADTDGPAQRLEHYDMAMDVFVSASSVTTGATVQLQAQSPNGDWHDLLSATQAAIAADGFYGPFHVPVGYPSVRGRVSGRTDGTYTATLLARR